MTHNVYCDSYRVYNVTYLLQYSAYIGVKYVTCVSVPFPGTIVHWLGCWLLCPLWLYWFSCFLVFRWMGGVWWGCAFHLFFVVCYCFLFWIGCVLSNSEITKYWRLLCIHEVCLQSIICSVSSLIPYFVCEVPYILSDSPHPGKCFRTNMDNCGYEISERLCIG